MRRFESLKDGIILPRRASMYSAGYDFFMPEEIIIKPHSQVLIKTFIRAAMNDDEFLAVYLRSSLGIKKGLRLVNQTGIIDKDYYNNVDNGGNIMVALENTTNKDVVIKKGEAFVQGIFMKYFLTDDDDTKGVRNGGIGSSNHDKDK